MKHSLILGADIGGSHITTALVDTQHWTVLEHTRNRKSVDPAGASNKILSLWCTVIEETLSKYSQAPTAFGLAIPGPFNYQQGISLMRGQNKYDALYGVNVKKSIADFFNIKMEDITITNDAESFLEGELKSGVAKGYHKPLAITLGTGLGSAFSDYGNTRDADLWSSSFKEGIAEDYFSTRWFQKRYLELTGQELKNVKELASMRTPADDIFDEFGNNLAEFINVLIEKNPRDIVVLGGNISASFDYFSKALGNALNGVPVLQSALGENASVIGAAAACIRKTDPIILNTKF